MPLRQLCAEAADLQHRPSAGDPGESDMRLRARPELAPLLADGVVDGFFVQPLEHVQSDERDTIIFSLGYGPDANGLLTTQFGPINRAGGKRRLNVAITRARHRQRVVTPFLPSSHDVSDSRSRGVHLLRRFLSYAEQGAEALIGQSRQREASRSDGTRP